MRFVDTNVLLYAVSTDPAEAHKRRRADELLSERDLALSVEVLQEFFVQATRRDRSDRLSHDQAVGLIESFSRFPVQEITAGVMRSAFETCHRYDISYWDAAIVEAARVLGCDAVLTEDLSDGQDFDGVTVIDPFASR